MKSDCIPRVYTRLIRLIIIAFIMLLPALMKAQDRERKQKKIVPTLGLNEGMLTFETPSFNLKLVKASQTIAALQPKSADGFDFTPSDWLNRRNGDGFFHLGDLTLRLRTVGTTDWQPYSTAGNRNPVTALSVSGSTLAKADLSPTLSAGIPLQINRSWKLEEGKLVLLFELTNKSDKQVEIGALGIPMVFNNILSGKELDKAHADCSFYDPYIGQEAGYLQVTRLNGHGPVLLVVPEGSTSFEAYNPLLSDPTPRGITFEGFYEWMVHTKSYTENEWSKANPWNPPTSEILEPGETRRVGVKFVLSDTIRDIESTLIENKRPVAVGIPGYVLPEDQKAQLFLKYGSKVESIKIEPQGALNIKKTKPAKNGWATYQILGRKWGRARLTIAYKDGLTQSVNYKVIKPETQVVDDLGHFLTTKQWFDKPNDPFHRNPSVISYDYDEKHQVTEDNRAWIAGLSDEGGAGSWLAAMMKQLVQPEPEEIRKLELFVDKVLWGGLQYADGEQKYGVRKSMFYYAPAAVPEGTYSSDVRYGGWSSWDEKQAHSVGRSYNYPHVAAAYWVLYRLARDHKGLVTNHSWQWYLDHACQTSEAMVKYAPHYAQFGQMEGTIFLKILLDLEREGMTDKFASLKNIMKKRADLWRSLGFPFGSEMPWDSTGQEEVYAWCRYFGFEEKATVTLNAILGYMPTVPHWGYNGSARRYWDFLFGGKTRRLERQLHHYGSGLNAIPVLAAYRDHPDDFYLLRVGYGGLMGSISNITQEGFGSCGFHSFPSMLAIDAYSGDYGPNFFGHAINTGTYLIDHPEFGWLVFGGNLETQGNWMQVRPLDSARSRFYLATMGLWLTLDAGTFDQVDYNSSTGEVRLTLSTADVYTSNALLHIQQPAREDEVGQIAPKGSFPMERGGYIIPLKNGKTTTVMLTTDKS